MIILLNAFELLLFNVSNKNRFVVLSSSDMVKISMDTFVKRFQPENYIAWISGNDIGPHPEDAPSDAKPAPLPSDEDLLVNRK